jgi:hypothetical protein
VCGPKLEIASQRVKDSSGRVNRVQRRGANGVDADHIWQDRYRVRRCTNEPVPRRLVASCGHGYFASAQTRSSMDSQAGRGQ